MSGQQEEEQVAEMEGLVISEVLDAGAVFGFGLSLIILGSILYVIGRSRYGKAVVEIREDLIDDAKQKRDNLKQHELHQEIASIQRLPRMGAVIIVIGGVILAAAVGMHLLS